ncbi:thioredoxin family protein [Paenibacillus lignilyticus]|uniref:Thioredoxin n=1 Tax=Paenibacillus lignilyticus TaxID=1172615 RepID=A0ABS5CFV2_9BACL|nr:thioredoxin family protein [Paenibacillus lignilyticus]MBP3964742.1 thioredoxin family protein [Paenibacillus lignilyticus]
MGIQQVQSMEHLHQLVEDGVVLVDYGAPHCPPCHTLLPVLEELSAELEHQLRIAYVDCDKLPEAAASAGVMGTPTVIVFKNGRPMDKLVGLRPKAAYRLAAEKQL